jgi:choline kinase
LGLRTARSRPIAVVVLAAGRGLRLHPVGLDGPKWLLPVAGRPIGDYQLDGVRAAALPEDRLLVVTGYRADVVGRWLAGRGAPVPVETVHNPRWHDLNNWHSLLVAVDRLLKIDWQGGVVVLNSDLCAPPAWYAAFLTAVRGRPAGEAALAVDFERPLTDEAMKVSGVGAENGPPYCTRIGKCDVGDSIGEYVGMAAFAPGDWRLLGPALRAFRDAPEHADEWYEAAFQRLIDSHRLFRAWPTPTGHWVEVDDPADWHQANTVMASGELSGT